ncbi:MAG: sulfotransferase domain-containing protein [Elainellaceae cyanobacterium]
MKNLIWIASYPKSGNTWMRYIITALFYNTNSSLKPENLVGLSVPDTYRKELLDIPEVNLFGQNLAFAKTHACGIPDIGEKFETVGFIYVYRHPLDVLLSAINFSYIRKYDMFFHDGHVHSADELKASGDIDLYLEKFSKNLAIKNYVPMSNSWIENVSTWVNMTDEYKFTIIFRYEDLLENTLREVQRFKDIFPVSDEQIQEALDFADQNTNDGGNFFWKRRAGNYKDYFSENSRRKFYAMHHEVLDKLGYPFNR